MGFLDTIKDRLRGGAGDDYYEDDYYDDEEGYEGEQGGYAHESRRRDTGSSPRLLGNTPRPEAESVSVFTRSGRPVSARPAPSQPSQGSYSSGGYADDASRHSSQDVTSAMRPIPTPGDLGPRTISRANNSGQLPPYVLKPVSYDDVQTVVRRVRTGQPVVLVFRNTNIETAKRILDFSFGLSFGIGGEVSELGDRVFVVLPCGIELARADIDKLVADGDLVR